MRHKQIKYTWIWGGKERHACRVNSPWCSWCLCRGCGWSWRCDGCWWCSSACCYLPSLWRSTGEQEELNAHSTAAYENNHWLQHRQLLVSEYRIWGVQVVPGCWGYKGSVRQTRECSSWSPERPNPDENTPVITFTVLIKNLRLSRQCKRWAHRPAPVSGWAGTPPSLWVRSAAWRGFSSRCRWPSRAERRWSGCRKFYPGSESHRLQGHEKNYTVSFTLITISVPQQVSQSTIKRLCSPGPMT